MSFTEADVERIVVEVIRRLRAMEQSPGAVSLSPVIHDRKELPINHDLVLTERVITIRTVEGRLSGVQRLLVPPKAVVTPAVKDELKKYKIELVR